MCKLFEINGNGQKDFENLSFSWYYLDILLKNSHRELYSYYLCLALFLETGILCSFPLASNGNKLSVKLLKSLCEDII